jgi:HAD superfamily hydrolase (TIGR01509 family)
MNKISAIIIDLGGVILDIDQERTIRAFTKLGIDLEVINTQSSLFNDYERGTINTIDFKKAIRSFTKGDVTDNQLVHAWNAMLLLIPEERLKILERLRRKYKVYLLSNTNDIHMEAFYDYISKTFGIAYWESLFDGLFMSYKIGMRKPEEACYNYVCQKINLAPQECLFIDDNNMNIRGAEFVGMRTVLAHEPLGHSLLPTIQATLLSSTPEYN